MSTRAFLLCSDEKAVHAVAQILDELEVSFEHSGEPPFALKRLAVQRFDLLMVDCDNAQNATQVFNSARASNLNKNSIAIAIVEGKAGVPNAFRLGASLVLTKPVSLEQARNTLRTGIGMTKKDAMEAKPASAAPVVTPTPGPLTPPAPTVAVPVGQAPIQAPSPTAVTPVAPHPVAPAPMVPAPVAKAPVTPITSVGPATTAAPAQMKPTVVPAEKPAIAPKSPVPTPDHKSTPTESNAAKTGSTTNITVVSKAAAAAAGVSTSATAPAPLDASKFDKVLPGVASSVTAPESKASADEKAKASELNDTKESVLRIEDPLADEADVLDPLKDHGVPSFGGMGKQPFAGFEDEAPKPSKVPLIAALVLVLIGGSAYAVWATQPNFRSFMAWEYNNLRSKIDGMRRKAPATAAVMPQPAPVAPVPVPPVPAPAPTPNPENIDIAVAPGETADNAANTASPTATATNTTGTTPATMNPAVATSTAAASPAPPDAKSPKSATLQSAKQDAAPGHAASLVPASLPPTTVTKAPASDLLELPEDFADDQVVHRVHPTYPKQALVKKLHGSVVLQAIINKQGKVDSLQLVSGDATLAQAAATAVKQWRYRPYWHNNEPTDFQTRVTVDFKLP